MADHDPLNTEDALDAEPEADASKERLAYTPPKLTRWGTLQELTLGGGGTKNEPSKKKTRF